MWRLKRVSFCFLACCLFVLPTACQPRVEADQAQPITRSAPIAVRYSDLRPISPCSGHFVTHTLPFVTGTRLREINTYESNGAGLAINDLDGDGDLDLVFASIDRESSILWNQDNLNFTTETLPVRFTRGVAIVDVDGDGALDIVFTQRGLQSLSYWHNQGSGAAERFVQRPLPGVESYAYTMAWADLNGDNKLDLVTASYNTDLRQQGLKEPEADAHAGVILYEQQQDGFVAHPLSPKAEALAIALVDLNGDGQRDIWVANDFELQDSIWLQQPAGWQPASPFAQTSFSTMSIDWGDLTNAGTLTLYTTDMNPYDTSPQTLAEWLPMMNNLEARHQHEADDPQIMANTLQEALPGGLWRNLGNQLGIDATGWSWSGKFGDLDNDGYLDLYVVNGMIAQNLFGHLQNGELVEENQALRNQGDGSFRPAPEWQLGSTASGRGMMMADLDNDGDLDIVVNNLRTSAQLFENQLCGGTGLEVELHWPSGQNDVGQNDVGQNEVGPNYFAIGAQLRLYTSIGVLWRDVRATSGYLSGDPVRVHFGFPQGTTLERLEILWPDGARSELAAPLPQQNVTVTR
ncbi:MAG: CRTAC1 family protein [Caldilineaceae bacterium]